MLLHYLGEVNCKAFKELPHFRVCVQQIFIVFLFPSYSPKWSGNFQIITLWFLYWLSITVTNYPIAQLLKAVHICYLTVCVDREPGYRFHGSSASSLSQDCNQLLAGAVDISRLNWEKINLQIPS